MQDFMVDHRSTSLPICEHTDYLAREPCSDLFFVTQCLKTQISYSQHNYSSSKISYNIEESSLISKTSCAVLQIMNIIFVLCSKSMLAALKYNVTHFDQFLCLYKIATESAAADSLLKKSPSEQLYYMTAELAIFQRLENRFRSRRGGFTLCRISKISQKKSYGRSKMLKNDLKNGFLLIFSSNHWFPQFQTNFHSSDHDETCQASSSLHFPLVFFSQNLRNSPSCPLWTELLKYFLRILINF